MTFPTLKQFGKIILTIAPAITIGELPTGGSQLFVNITGGTLTTEPNVSPAVKAHLVMGGDWIHADPSGDRLRLDVRTVLKTDDDAAITLLYTGIITLTPHIRSVLDGTAAPGPTGFGHVAAAPQFQTGAEKYRHLENQLFVMTGQFIVAEKEQGGGTSVEYHISQVIA